MAKESSDRRWFFGVYLLVAIAGACMLPLTATARSRAPSASAPVVRTANGTVRGTALQGMSVFLGIPYAAPPIGPRRWEPPAPAARWTTTRDATRFAPHCPQLTSPFGIASVSEDCLYLNVFAPAGTAKGARLPVMVWIHGGAFTSGESDDYDPDRLVAHGVIVVTINYRLGLLGFLATSGLDAEPHAHVNYGLLDQQSALAWTKANIAAFGGDPGKTTIFGQSAGGESALLQVFAPSSSGLFSRAIVQSGAYDILSLPTLAVAEAGGNQVAAALGCPAASTACLRASPVSALLAVQQQAAAPLIGGPSPAIDGSVIPQPPQTALLRGAYTHVPLIAGTNHDEFRLFTAEIYDLMGGPLSAAEYPLAVEQTLAAAGLEASTPAVLAQYPLSNYASADLAYAAFTTDAVFSTPAFITDTLFGAGTPVYAYEFSDEAAPEDFLPPVSFPYGSAHGSELQFLFDSTDRTAPPLLPAQERLASTMTQDWAAFATYATPNTFTTPLWAPYSVLFDDMESLVPATKLFYDFVPEHKALFWTSLLAGEFANGTQRFKRGLTLADVKSVARRLRARPAGTILR